MSQEPPLDSRGDRDLLACFVADGRQEAFAALVRRHGDMVLRVCRARLGNAADAEDAAQAVFLTLARRASSLSRHQTLAGWLYRVAWYVAGNAARVRLPRLRHEQEAARMSQPANNPASDLPIPPEALYAGLHALAEKYRLPLILHHLQGKTESETAALLGISVSAASVTLARGRQKLRNQLARLGAFSTVALAAALSAPASAVPASFVTTATQTVAAAMAGQVVAGSIFSLSQGAIHMLFMAKLKLAAMVTAAVMLVGGAGVGTYLVADITPSKRDASNVPRREAPSGEEDQNAVDSVMLTADGCSYTLAGPPGRRNYSVAMADGQVLFAGPVNTSEQTKALDARMLAKLRELEVLLGGPNAIPLPSEQIMGSGLTPARAAAESRPATTARATGTITGKIVDDAGKPVGGARITLSLPKSATPGKTLATTTSDNNGVFAMNDVAPARDYGIAVGAGKPGGEETLLWGAVYGVNVTAGKTADVGTIKLIRGPQM